MDGGTEKLIVVSGDSHATPPPEAWPDYLETRYHEFLPEVHEDNELYGLVARCAEPSPELIEAVIDTDGAWTSCGYLGCWSLDRRVAEMDREGIAAELVYSGDPRAIPLLNPLFREYPQDVIAAGKRAYHRWAADVFGAQQDRLLLVGDAASEVDMAAMLKELTWTAEHGFVATHLPGAGARRDFPSLDDEFFEPFWSTCEELGLPLVVHAGYGSSPREFGVLFDEIRHDMEEAGRTDFLAEMMTNARSFFTLDARPRRAMWQMMLGGVFDRHPKLVLLMSEVRADWLPATLRHLDAVYEQARGDLPARRPPSELWHSNCAAVASFIHRSEVAMRHEIGVETIGFGRDYPHFEGTWPNTAPWLSDAFAGVPEDEVRLMLGENLIRLLGLDRAHVAAVADRIGPTVEQVIGTDAPTLDPRLLATFQTRGGYLKPIEQFDPRLIDALLEEDVARAAGG
jgi:predicted TIM-barrel fold metal-dependent hydrolase